jgi:Uma2 family endonuclease
VLPCFTEMRDPDASRAPQGVFVRHRVPGFSDEWVIGPPVPEAPWHDRAAELLKALLLHWVARTARDAAVFRNLAIRVNPNLRNVGFDPDVCVVEPAPQLRSSLRLWEPGHTVPSFVAEVVSPGHPHKDYAEIPDQCAAVGVRELVVFDPLLVGPKALGGARRIQVWRRTETGDFDRVAAGEGPFESEYLGAFLVAKDDECLRIADDAAGARLWPTPEEAERAQKEAALARERETLAREEAALARVAELERLLAERKT